MIAGKRFKKLKIRDLWDYASRTKVYRGSHHRLHEYPAFPLPEIEILVNPVVFLVLDQTAT